MLRERLGELRAAAPLARRLDDVRAAAAPSRCPTALPRGRRRGVFSTHEDRIRHAAGRGYPDLVRMRSGGSRTRPTPSSRPRTPTGAPRCSGLRGRGRGGRPLRRRHQRRRRRRAAARRAPRRDRLDLTGLRASRSTRLADRPPRAGPARARGGGGARRSGAHPRPLPAVLRVRDDRRLRRDPLGRPGLERLRALRRHRQRGRAHRAGRRVRTLETPHTAAGPALREPTDQLPQRRPGGGVRRFQGPQLARRGDAGGPS